MKLRTPIAYAPLKAPTTAGIMPCTRGLDRPPSWQKPLIISTLKSATRPCAASPARSLHVMLGKLRAHSTIAARNSVPCSKMVLGIVEFVIVQTPSNMSHPEFFEHRFDTRQVA